MLIAIAESAGLLGLPALVLALYGAKIFALKLKTPRASLVVFLAVLLVLVPLTWVWDWNNPNVTQVGLLLGSPLAILTVPVISFLLDLSAGPEGNGQRWNVRTTLEALVVVPCWFYFILRVSFTLGWFWI